MIIHDIYRSRTSKIEFLYKHIRGWNSSEQAGPGATSVDLVNIEELEEDEAMEQQYVEAQQHRRRTLLRQD
jgi:hypothetical protein